MKTHTKAPFLKLSLIALFLFSIPAAGYSSYLISSLDFRINPTAQTAKIGDTVHFNMAVIDASQTYLNITNVVSVNTASIVISSLNFPAVEPTLANPLYVYDGTRTWRVTNYTNSAIRSVTLDNTNMIAGFSMASYMTLEYADFNGASGVMASGGAANAAIGSILPNVTLYDNADLSQNDALANDGVYNCVFEVREAYNFNLFGGNIDGYFFKAGSPASNNGYRAQNKINIDGIRPYVLAAYTDPGVFSPKMDVLQIFYGLSESGNVKLNIYYNNVTIRTMTAQGNYQYNNFPFVWDGLSNTGAAQTDGRYEYVITVTDQAGNTGVAYKSVIVVTTVEIETELSVVDPIYTHGNFNEMVATLTVKQRLKNATRSNLVNLGFDAEYNNTTTYSSSHQNYPYMMAQIRIFDGSGGTGTLIDKDASPGYDMDRIYCDQGNDPRLYDEDTGVLLTVNQVLPYGDEDMCGLTNTVVYMSKDGDTENDWDNVFYTPPVYQGNGVYYREYTFTLYSESYSPGTYFFGVTNKLTGKALIMAPETSEGSTPCEEDFFFIGTNAYPHITAGLGLTARQEFIGFIVEPYPAGTQPDTTAPVVVENSEYPSSGTIVDLGEINTSNFIKVTISDSGVGPGSINQSTITLTDPNGSPVPGKKAWDGGTAGSTIWELYYIPDNPLTLGGKYTLEVTPVDGAGNIGGKKTFEFSVLDPKIPVSDVTVVSASGGFVKLSQSSTSQVNFLVSRIKATLTKGSSVDVDWAASTVTVRDSSGALVSGTSAYVTGTNIIEFKPSVSIKDGKYTVYVTAVSQPSAGKVYTAVYSYKFYVTTAGNYYVNIMGTAENSTTYMRIASFSETVSGIYASGIEIAPSNITVAAVDAASIYPPPTGYQIMGSVVAFSVPGFSMPLSFNSNFCEASLRMHYTQAQKTALSVIDLAESDLTLWKWNGASAWVQIQTISAPINSGTDNYLETVLADIPGNNQYAIMYPYTPPSGGGTGGGVVNPVVRYDNTKAFNPNTSAAKIYFADNLSEIGPLGGTGNVEVTVYSASGQKIRDMQYQNASENSLFTGYDSNPYNSLEVRYYIAWDGKNDKGQLVRNGIYMLKIKITKATGEVQTISRLLAVVK